MKTTRVTRRLVAYSLHAHGKGFDGSYDGFFDVLQNLDRSARITKISDLVIAISSVSKVDGYYFLKFVEGEEGVNPLILDLDTGATRIDQLEDHEMLGSEAHAMVNAKARRVLIEYVRQGAKADLMARAIEQVLSPILGADFRLSFSPIVEGNFVKEIDRFRRIRIASLTLIKPNAGWNDHYTRISNLLDESDGEKAELSVRAGRGESLRSDAGIVKVIKDVSSDEQPYLLDAQIVGVKHDEDVESSLPLRHHVLNRSVSVPRQTDGSVNSTRLRERMRLFMETLF